MVAILESDLKASLGAILVGGLVCTWLAGIVGMQTALYFRMFSDDHLLTKLKVAAVFILDMLHTVMVAISMYMYLVDGFGQGDITDRVFWAIGITIGLTAVLTAVVHFSFTQRLYKLSKSNYLVTLPITILAMGRVAAAFVTAANLIRLGSYIAFGAHLQWVFTLGLVLSSAVDFLITGGLCYYLRKNRTGNKSFNHVLDSVTLYTVENGSLTSLTTLVSLIFWLVRPHVLIYLGLHFAISKLYANSFLASMNARKILQAQSQSLSHSDGLRLPVIFTNQRRQNHGEPFVLSGVQITVDKTVDYETNSIESPVSARVSNHQNPSKTLERQKSEWPSHARLAPP